MEPKITLLPAINLSDRAFFIIPAYNEAEKIGFVVTEIINHGFKAIVIDDCSSDDTKFVAFNAGATVLSHQVNLGQGAALQTGIQWGLMNGGDFFVTFDADGQHRLFDAKKLLSIIMNKEADIAIGSRFLGIEAVNMPAHKKVILKLATLFT